MEKELYDLIEAYLDGALPDEKRRAVEERMATDEDFRQEVEIHRDLQESYADPERWQFRQTLQEIMKEPLASDDPDQEIPETDPVPAASKSFQKDPPPRKIILEIIFILLLGVGIWYWVQSDQPAEVPQAPAPVQTPTPDNPTGAPTQTDPKTPEKPQPQQPIAKADPANFRENRTMEALIMTRDGGGLSVDITRPKPGERFKPMSSGKTRLRFSGTIEGLSDTTDFKVQLLIFNNINANTPLLTQPLDLSADSQGNATFDIAPQVDFPQGLYYYRLEDEDSVMLAAGKFFIGSLAGK